MCLLFIKNKNKQTVLENISHDDLMTSKQNLMMVKTLHFHYKMIINNSTLN